MAADFSSSDLIEPLAETLIDGDHDLKYAAVTALEQIKDIRAREALRAALELVDDNEIRDLIIEVLDSPPL